MGCETRMNTKCASILVIGVGAHARRIYFPVFLKDGQKHGFRFAHGVDLQSQRESVTVYLQAHSCATSMSFIPDREATCDPLPDRTARELSHIVKTHGITGVIISTPPLMHMAYARWALQMGLSILLDKPITARENLSVSGEAVEGLRNDYRELASVYSDAKERFGHVLCSIMVQRRYHPVFIKTRELVREVLEKTNCPITSIQTFHCDGQWRLPAEIVDVNYHPFNSGYGKCCHSGYHFFDIVQWLLSSTEGPHKRIDNVEVFSNFLRPQDYFRQLTTEDYGRLFANYCEHNPYSDKVLHEKCAPFGEIDAHSSFAFKMGDRILALGTINLSHNGFSQRGWVSSVGRDLYKGNGRLRHEFHFIEQGPFQAISLNSYQSREVEPARAGGLYETGGEYHFDVHIFRNSSLFPEWQTYREYSVKDLSCPSMTDSSRGHQEDAKRQAVLEFVRFLQGDAVTPVSDLITHGRTVQLMYGVYKSAVNRYSGIDGLAKVEF